MAMSHRDCDHPSTPADRAKCRRRQETVAGIVEDAKVDRAANGPRYQVRGPHAGKRGSAGQWTVVDTHDRNIAVDSCRTKSDATASARELNAGPARPGEVVDENGKPDRSFDRAERRRLSEVHANAPKGRRRFIRTEGDMAVLAVPHAFSAVIRHAWSQGYEVRVAEPYNPTEKRIEVRNSHGDATLVWRPSMAHGVWGCFWRPIRSSVTSQVTTVNQLISRMNGKGL